MDAQTQGIQVSTLKSKIRAKLPSGAFQPHPGQGLLLIPMLVAILGGTWTILAFPLPWYLSLFLGILLGNIYASLAFFGHEVMHGSVFKKRWAQNVVGYLSTLLFWNGPTLWRAWHNEAHHGHPNHPFLDPDSISLKKLEKENFSPLLKKFLPTGFWQNILFLCFGMTLQGQLVLWKHSRFTSSFKSFHRMQAIIESFLIIAFWLLIAFIIGFQPTLYVIIVPMIVANFILMAYAVLLHSLRPQVHHSNSLDSSISTVSMPLFGYLHFNFGYHVEHHLFPQMNWIYYPSVRKHLKKLAGDHYLSPSHLKALWVFLKTPHIYEDPHTLINIQTGKRSDIDGIEAELRGLARGKI